MAKLKTFFHIFKNSLSPSYYLEIIKAPFLLTLKYFLFFFFLISIFTSLAFSFLFYRNFLPYLTNLSTKLPQLYPEELVITIKNGILTTNVSEPFFVPLNPKVFPNEIAQALERAPIQNILVIDTKAEPSEIRKYQTLTFLTKDSLAFQGNRNEIRIQSLQEIKDFTLNSQIFKGALKQIMPVFKWLIPSLTIGLFIFLPFFLILSRFIYLAIFSLFSWILSRLFRNFSLNFGKALQINLVAVTVPTLITALFQLLGATPQIPFFGSIILFIFNLIIFASLKEKEVK